jgi:twitching motility protein PilT
MAAIGSLLGIVDMKKADGLILATDEVPALLVGSARNQLKMPPLEAPMLAAFLDELLQPELRARLQAAGQVETSHDAGARGTFALSVRVAAGKTTIVLTRPGAASAAPPPSAPDATDREQGALWGVLDRAIARRASDVLLSPGLRPLLRVGGDWIEGDASPVDPSDIERTFVSPLSEARRRTLAESGSVDLALGRTEPGTGAEVRFRVSLFRHHTGLSAAMRFLWTALASLPELNLPAALLPVVDVRHGLVVMTGATGSGKSTTLAALLEHVNRVRACHVITLEDPIEYVFRPRRAIIHQREVGTHVDSFASGLRAALRESPNVILVGEMRDRETIRLALTAAETGHLVMSTLHSGTAALAVDRIVDAFDDAERIEVRQQLSGVLRHVIAQQLVTTPRGERIPVLEMLTVTHAVAAQIREGRTHLIPAQMDVEAGERMGSMERALAELVRAGRLDRQAALDASQRPDEVRRLLDDRGAGRR